MAIRRLASLVFLRGIILLLLGLLTVIWPGITFMVLSYFFSIYILVAGILNILYAITGIPQNNAWFIRLLWGIAEIAVSIYLLHTPALQATTFSFILGIIIIIQGILEIIVSFVDVNFGTRILDSITGALGILVGYLLWRYPLSTGITFIWVLGLYGVVLGCIRIALALALFVKGGDTNDGRRK